MKAKNPNAGKYASVEKILYLANQEKGLNVAKNEGDLTDLGSRVIFLLASNYIDKVDEDSDNYYYTITEKGKIKLLQLQIETRKKLGKSIDLHELQLEELLGK